MQLERLTCRGFRCLDEIDFLPEPGINILHGGNAQGKTSILEAILFVTTSKSHRTNLDTDLVAHGTNEFRIKARVKKRDRDTTIETTWSQGAKRFKVNGVPQDRLSDILGKVNVILFSPEDIALVKGTAAHRRKYLDMALSQIDGPYLNNLQQYRQTLRQRNELLRKPKPDPELLDVWDAQLARHADPLMAARDAFLRQLALHAAALHNRIAGDETLDIAYKPNVPPGEPLPDLLARTRDADLKYRVTSRGPHRDDFTFTVEGQPARNYASQGQQRTTALAVKLAELQLAKDRTGEYPVLLLDEALSELDKPRAHRLFGAIENEVQCLVTTTSGSAADIPVGQQWPRYRIKRGSLEKD